MQLKDNLFQNAKIYSQKEPLIQRVLIYNQLFMISSYIKYKIKRLEQDNL